MRRIYNSSLRAASSSSAPTALHTGPKALTMQISSFGTNGKTKARAHQRNRVQLKPRQFRHEMDFPVAVTRTKPSMITDLEDLDDGATFSKGAYANSAPDSSAGNGVHDFSAAPSTDTSNSFSDSKVSKSSSENAGDGEGGLGDRDVVPGRGMKPHKLRNALSEDKREVVGVAGDIATQKMIREG